MIHSIVSSQLGVGMLRSGKIKSLARNAIKSSLYLSSTPDGFLEKHER